MHQKNSTVMVVEDESIVARHIHDVVESLGYTIVAMASNGKDAISKATSKKPDLILMDIKLENGMDGISAVNEIRKELDVPVIYLTAYTDTQILQRAKKSGPFNYIVKPFDENELSTTIEIAIHNHAMKKKLNAETYKN